MALLTYTRPKQLVLQIFAHPARTSPSQWRLSITACQDVLKEIRSRPSPSTPPRHSSAFSSFDPAICRKLVIHAPLPVIELMEIKDAWNRLDDMLAGLENLANLDESTDLLAWKVCTHRVDEVITLTCSYPQTSLTLFSRESEYSQRNAYIRSRTTVLIFTHHSYVVPDLTITYQTSFTLNGVKIFNQHSREWIVTETLRVVADIAPSIWHDLDHSGWDRLLSTHAAYADRIWTSFQGILSDVSHSCSSSLYFSD